MMNKSQQLHCQKYHLKHEETHHQYSFDQYFYHDHVCHLKRFYFFTFCSLKYSLHKKIAIAIKLITNPIVPTPSTHFGC